MRKTVYLLIASVLLAVLAGNNAQPIEVAEAGAGTALGQSDTRPLPLHQGTILWEIFAEGLDQPTDIASAGDARIFIVERSGRIRVVEADGEVLATPFLDIQAQVDSSTSERGLLGLVFHPNYSENGYFYVNYTDAAGDTQVSRFSVSAGNSNIADPDSEYSILQVSQPATNHNAGDLAFGPDGYLYVPLGDGGGGGDPDDRAQDGTQLLGKILRIDVNQGDPYAIPGDNPFVGNADVLDEIWAMGFRNPWRLSFDRTSGDLYIADVGQSSREEVDFQPFDSDGGENYGWRCYEGTLEYNLSGCLDRSAYVFPVTEYSHDLGCSIAGGFVYRGTNHPQLNGLYFFGDYCSGNLWTLAYEGPGDWVTDLVGDFGFRFTTFGEDNQGELYAADYSTGIIYRLAYDPGEGLPPADFDGDGDTDFSIYRPSSGGWYIRDGNTFTWGLPEDIPVPADYDGDGDADGAVYRPSNGRWYIRGLSSFPWGAEGDIPMPCDYDGDGDADPTVFRPSTGRWYIRSESSLTWGVSGDLPVPADYDGDGICEIAVFRPANGRWYIRGGADQYWGVSEDIPVPGDYDGDGDTDLAVFRPSNGRWYMYGEPSFSWGLADDIPVSGDYDGDGGYDAVVFRPSNGRWYVRGGSSVSWGMAGDYPLPARDTNGDGDPHD